MSENEFPEFSRMLDAVCGLLTRGAYAPSPPNAVMFFRSMSRYDTATVRAAFDAHVADPVRGKFAPVPADLIAQIEAKASDDGRPGAEEAWAVVLGALDESRTIVWTAEMSLAWGTARIVHSAGDEVGARMAFREAYTRLVSAARTSGTPVEWTASLGFDATQRDAALAEAHVAGFLPRPDKLAQIAGPDNALSPSNSTAPKHVREQLAALRAKLAAKVGGLSDVPGPIAGDFNLIDPRSLPPGMQKGAE